MQNRQLQLLYSRNRKEIKSSAKKLKKVVKKPFSFVYKEVDNFMRGYVDIVLTYNIENLYRGRLWKRNEYPSTYK